MKVKMLVEGRCLQRISYLFRQLTYIFRMCLRLILSQSAQAAITKHLFLTV